MSWKQFLTSGLRSDLKEMGALIRLARERQGRTQKAVAHLLGVDPRVIAQIEKGAPEVSTGVFLQYLDILGLLRGWKLLFEPEIDITSLSEEIKKHRKQRRAIKPVPASKVDF
jgi:transcriptional regulator with XRE-family HTH domain